MNPEYYDYIMTRLFDEGALDVYLTPIQMKKNRPGVKLSVLSLKENQARLSEIILNETSSLGVRIFQEIDRLCLERKQEVVNTPWGEIEIKVAYRGGKIVNLAPEYEDCRQIAEENSIPIKNVYQRVIEIYHNNET